jgi:hypothetical protein
VPADTDKRGGLNNLLVLFKNFKMIRFSAFSLRLALGAAAALAAISLSPGSAQAFVVTVGGVQYDVTTFTGSYLSDTNKFETAANGGVMPWWDSDSSLAETFASQVGLEMGLPNYSNIHGPLFAWRFRLQDAIDNCYYIGGGIGCGIANNSIPYVYAQATPYAPPSTPVPGPLPLFGAAAAFGFSRKLRKRIKLAPGALGSSLPLA